MVALLPTVLFFGLLPALVGDASAGNVNRLGGGSWLGATTQYTGAVDQDYNVWVDMSVYNLAWQKDVGVRWTDDHWATSHDASAWYEASLGGGWEQWGVDIAPIGTRSSDARTTKWSNFYGSWRVVTAPVTIEYALYYRVAGAEYWDNNGGQNYSLTLW